MISSPFWTKLELLIDIIYECLKAFLLASFQFAIKSSNISLIFIANWPFIPSALNSKPKVCALAL